MSLRWRLTHRISEDLGRGLLRRLDWVWQLCASDTLGDEEHLFPWVFTGATFQQKVSLPHCLSVAMATM